MSAQPLLKELFGGAIVARLPANFIDASDLRQVPDSQEVFLDRDGTDSIVFDLCQRVEGEGISTDVDALKYHAEDIVEGPTPSITSISTVNVPHLPDTTPSLTCFISAPANDHGRYTGILLLLTRLNDQTTDVVVTFNLPDLSVHEDVVIAEQDALSRRLQMARAVMAKIIASFQIKDWTLFG